MLQSVNAQYTSYASFAYLAKAQTGKGLQPEHRGFVPRFAKLRPNSLYASSQSRVNGVLPDVPLFSKRSKGLFTASRNRRKDA